MKTCLGALFVKDAEAASWYSDFQVLLADERVFHMKGINYLVYTNKELVATKMCGPNQERIQITEGTSILVPRGCKVEFDNHQIYGEESICHTTMKTQIFNWKWDAKPVLRNIT